MGVFIGLDVSLSKTAVCVVDRDGAVLWQGKVKSEPEPLIARLAEWSGKIDLAGIEACPLSEWLHRGLREMMRLGHYRPVHVKSPAAQSMRTTLVARMQLVSAQLQIENSIRGLLRL